MKRLFLALMVLSLAIAACGSSEAGEPPAVDEESMIETRVASTVAAALGDNAANATTDIAPTEPAISGDATPLTPIPRLEEPPAEVSPEVEYADEGRQDGQLTFDFGGGATVEPTLPSDGSPLGIGDTIVVGDYQTITLLDAHLVDSYVDGMGSTIAREGYRYVLVRAAIDVLQYLSTIPRFFFEPSEPYLLDTDDYPYRCLLSLALIPRVSHEYYFHYEVESASVFPGYSRVFEYVCEVPVTVADDLGEFKVQIGYSGSDCPDCPKFDLSETASVPSSQPTLEEERHFDLNEPINVTCFSSDGFETANIVLTFSNARWTGRNYVPEYSLEPMPEMGVLSVDIQTHNQGRSDWPGMNNFWGMPLEPGEHTPRFQPTLDNALQMAANSTYDPIPPGGTTTETIEFGVDKRSQTVNLAIRVNQSCTYNGQPYMIVKTGLPGYEQTGNQPSSDAVGDASTQSMELSVRGEIERMITDILVDQGQQVTISHVSGQWQPGPAPNWPPVGPQGDSRVPEKTSFPKPDAPLMALAFGVEGSATVFVFEENPTTFVAPAAGRLWFGPNDDGFDDNAGELVISISLE